MINQHTQVSIRKISGSNFLLLLSFLLLCSSQANAQVNMIPTGYDDGKSCPGNCDAHVVFAPVHNGTLNAYDPGSSRAAPRPCTLGQHCKICFSAEESSCILATYRGAGPPSGRFDFTPAFYEGTCDKPNLPTPLAVQCQGMNQTVARLRQRINCFDDPTNSKCTTLMTRVQSEKSADDLLYDECKMLGETEFNRKYRANRRMQRSNGCSYEKFGTGRNSHGVTWKKLLHGACRSGTYAGRDGLDCCSKNPYSAAVAGITECGIFFPVR